MILKNEIEREKQDLTLVATEENGPHRHSGERTWDLMLVRYDNLTICVSVCMEIEDECERKGRAIYFEQERRSKPKTHFISNKTL